MRLVTGAFCAIVLLGGSAAAQTADDDAGWQQTTAPPGASPIKRSSAGLCTIMRGNQVLEQQNCKALADTAGADGGVSGIAYLWPSGNRTVVGGTEDDFTVNGNLAVPLSDTARGLCLKVERTGNTFCYKEGAKLKVAAAPAPEQGATAPAQPKAAPPGATPVAAATAAAPAAAATAPSIADQLAEELKLRKAAEEEAKSLKAEIARLNETEERRLAEIAAQRKSDDQKKAEEAARRSAEEKARAEAALKELEKTQIECRARNAAACERAIALAREAAVTGSTDTALIGELEHLRKIAVAPLGIAVLSPLAGVPASTWAASSIAAFLALALLVMTTRRHDHNADFEPAQPSLDVAPLPSLNPFAAEEPIAPASDPFPPAAPASMRTTPPPIPAFPQLEARFPALKES